MFIIRALWKKKKNTLDQTTNWKSGTDSDLKRRQRSGLLSTFPLCLLIVGAAVCVYYMYLSHIVYQIFISVSFKLNIFQRSLVKMLWITLNHLYSSLRMLIFVLVLMSVNMQISLAACLCFNFIQMMDQMHNFSLMKCCVLTLKPQKCWELMFKAYKESFVRSLHRTCELLKDDFSNKNQKKSCTIFSFFFSMSKFIYF